MLRSSFRTLVAALIVGADVALLVVFLNISGWLQPTEGPVFTPTPWATSTPIAAAQATPSPRTVTVHVVKSGEVLAEIAQRYGLSVQDIVKASGLSDPNTIRAGQALTIPIPPAR